jgi:hypothetical protein
MRTIVEWFAAVISRMALSAYIWSVARHKPEAFRDLIRAHAMDLEDACAKTSDHLEAERRIIEQKLMRRFDPSPIWNEAINRAIAAKKEAREPYLMMTGHQDRAFERQQESTRKALRNA